MEGCHSNALSVLHAKTQKGKNRNIFSWKLRTTMGYIFKVYTGSINSLAHYTAGRVDMLWVREAVFCFPVALVSSYSFHPDLQRLKIYIFLHTLQVLLIVYFSHVAPSFVNPRAGCDVMKIPVSQQVVKHLDQLVGDNRAPHILWALKPPR